MKLTTSSPSPVKLVALTLLAAVASACQAKTTSGPRVQTVMSPQVPFARYHTFSFGLAEAPPPGSTMSAGSLTAENRLAPLVGNALARRGYTRNADKADFVVRVGAGSSDVTPVDMHEYFVDDFGAGHALPGLSLAIDMYDAASGAAIWHGATIVALDRGHFDDELLEGIVTSAFAGFPRRDDAAVSSAATLTPVAPEAARPGESTRRL
jgi:Domain of unknown function (DUF4136)